MHYDADGPDVDTFSVSVVSLDDFRRHIHVCTAALVVGAGFVAEAEVD